MLFPMPDWNYNDTLTIKASRGRSDDAGGVNQVYVSPGVEIMANVAKPTAIPAIQSEQQVVTLRVTFTTAVNPDLTDPAGEIRKMRKGDGSLWGADGKLWNLTGPLVPRLDLTGNPVHYWGEMGRVA